MVARSNTRYVQIIPTNALLKNPMGKQTQTLKVQIIPTNALLKNSVLAINCLKMFK